jgi:SNF2 family DNA or RNA helicase
MLRRKKEEVLKDLPPKTIKNFYVDMTERQEELYINYYMRVKNEVKEMTQTQEEWNTNRFQILKHILRLRQIATHPEMFIKDEKIGSGKLDSLIELLEEITSEGHKTIVFSQFSTMLEIVRKELNIREMNGLIIDGSTRNREQILNKFKEEEEQRILLMTLKVGGVGLNLTEADYVIILDPWWNPAVEMQAIDRTHRIGQTMPVMVYRMISSSTIEEKVLELQRKKMAIMNDVVEGTTDMEKQISAEDIREMFD